MKNKPIRHKAENTFRFIPFSERIANIDVDVFHRVAHEYETEEEEECYFYQCIQKWNVLNLTEGYDKFKSDVESYGIITLPQLIHKKDHVIQVLLKHLSLRDTLYLQPLLEILVAVAKDLRKEFSQYYENVLKVLVELLNTNNPEQLEWTFTCLAYMFKFLWRSLVKNVKNAFVMLLPLLSDSKPNYIREFAAESFAFIVRKVKDRKTFLQHMISIVREREDGADGCGKLLFETIHGVTGQFHSCAEEMLHFLLQSLSDTELQDTLFEVLIQLVGNTVTKIHAKNSELFWNTLIIELKVLFEADNTEKHIDFLLQLCGTALEFKQGKFFHSNKSFVQGFVALNVQKLPQPVLLTYCKVVILLLLSENVKLTQENASSLTRKITNLRNEEIFLYFVDNIQKYTGFEALVLPNFLKLCLSSKLDEKYLNLLTKIILQKSPLCGSGINLDSWRKYSIDFGHTAANREMMAALSEKIVCEDIEKVLMDPVSVVCSLICLPHIVTTVDENLKEKLQQFTNFLCENINTAKTEEDQTKLLLFLLQISVETLVHLSDEKEYLLKCLEPLIVALLPLATNVEYLLSLKILDLLFTALRSQDNIVQMQTLVKLNEVLQNNFCSPYHEIRLFTAHIYTIFENLPEFGGSTEPEELKTFNLCYNSESLEPQVNTFRDQLRYLEYLTYGRRAVNTCSATCCSLVPLRYLCGVLYMNFQLLWEPVTKIIASHGQGLKTDEFWGFFGDELKKAMENAKNSPRIAPECVFIKAEFLHNVFQKQTATRDKPDFLNYVTLLWKTMKEFPGIAEEKNRFVVELVLDFITNKNGENAYSTFNCNIMEKGSESKDDELTNEDDNKKNTPSKKYKLKLLLAQLEVLSKMKNPKALYREPELNRLYFELLSHKNPEIQKEALNCIMTYKYKYLQPYQKNLQNLIDEKNFKNELVLFTIDSESTVVQAEHRGGLMPVVIQIVFAKMTSKIGLRTGGKSSGQLRRNIILRFLAGCTAEEMKLFVNKAFRMYEECIKGEQEISVEEIGGRIDLQRFLLPKRLLSSLNLLQLVFEHFGGLLSESLQRDLLKILIVIGLYTKKALETSAEVHAGYLPPLRMARSVCLKVLAKFFKLFEEFPWTKNEFNAIFETFVWPYVEKLPSEGIYSPTALLKLFSEWCSIPKYFPLLVKLKGGAEKEEYVLQQVIKLLLKPHCKASVVGVILEMLENLLTLQMEAEENNPVKMLVDNLRPIEASILKKLSVNEKLNYGSCILLPLVPSVLEKIKLKLESNRSISQRELSILSRISELVWEPAVSDNVLQIFLPIVLKRCSNPNEEIVNQQLNTVYNLLNNVEDPLKYVKQISPMFAAVNCVSGRKILCQMLKRISEKNNDFKPVSEMIVSLNAWDAKWVDQPDFEKRISSLKQIEELVANNAVGLDLGILLIYNCYYIVTREADLSLKDYGSHSLKILVPSLIKTHKTSVDYILNETVFALIRNGFKSKSDEIRHESIALLGCMARECADAHVVLQDLSKFANKIDLEVDCFENLTHMQLHRHARAILKVSQVLKELTAAPSTRTLTQFVLPMVTFYLCNDKYTNKNSLIDAVVEAMNTICRLLPWHQYGVVLRFYLRKLQYHKTEYQRQLVRVITAILDGFHYDLTKGQAEQSADASEPKLVAQANNSKSVEIEAGENVTEDSEEVKAEEENDDHIASDNEGEDEVLDEFEGEEEEVEAIEEDKKDESVVAVNKTTVLSKSAANRVIRTIETVLLPQLHRTLAEMTHYEEAHKVNRKKTGVQREEEDLVRVPISLAVVKLLQKLPKHILDRNLPRVFIKTCTFLRSHLESVRRVARETLQNILKTLGPDYLKVLLAEMVPLLNRGYQLHVLVYTIHAVLNCLKEFYKAGDINEVLITVLHICKADLFGAIAEEKEVVKIARKTSEAKSTKTYDTFKLLAQFITESCLLDLLLPVKEVLMSSHSYKIIYKAQECLRHVAIGLTENAYVPVESLLKFAYGVASESIPQLVHLKGKNSAEKREQNKLKKADCFILPGNPGRAGAKPQGKLTAGSNSHHLVQFALRLCHFLLRNERIKEVSLQGFLDPFVGIFKKCLLSRHVKLSTAALQCLCWTMKYNLPSVKENVEEISEAIFEILHKYAAATLSKGDNYDLVVAAFKAVAVLLRDVKCYSVDQEKLKILLLYAEQDLHDTDRQATAFNLLKAIISKKLSVSELYATMEKVSELSIVSELDHVRLQSRLVCLQYMLEYPLGKKLDNFVSFYMSQLNYELQSGREAALEMIEGFIKSFPLNTLNDYSGTFLVTLGASLVNDDVPECRKKAADCLKSMLGRLPQQERDGLFDVAILLFKDKRISHRQMAAHLCGLFILVEKEAFESRIKTLLPPVYSQFGLNDAQNSQPGRYVLLKKDPETTESTEKLRAKDHLYFQVLQMLLKLCAQCPQFLKMRKDVELLAVHVQTLLAHAHEWVRLAAAQFLGFVVASIDVEHLAELITKNQTEGEGYLYSDPRTGVETLTLDLCSQLQPGSIREEFTQQIIKILVFVARVLEKVPLDSDGDNQKLSLLWLTKRMRKIVNTEIVLAATSATLRTEVFKWIAGVCTVLEESNVKSVLHHLLSPLVRELLTKDEGNAQLRGLAKEVCNLIRQKVGMSFYSSVLSKVQQQLSVKRAERKRERTQLAVTDPELYARKKIKRHEKKKISKKRKREELKGVKRNFKKRRGVDLESEEIL